MRYQPSLQTERLRLRPFVADDAQVVSTLAGSKEIAATTTSIPHPYSLTVAKTWIAGLPHFYRTGMAVHFAACLIDTKELIGSFILKNIEKDHSHAEMELWVGASWLRQGYATEAAREVIAFGFTQLNLNRIYAYHIADDPAASHLLEKLGFQQEGILRQSICKWGNYQDMALTALLADEYKKMDI